MTIPDVVEIVARLDRLEAQNHALKKRVSQLSRRLHRTTGAFRRFKAEVTGKMDDDYWYQIEQAELR